MISIYTLSSSSNPNDIRYIGKTKNIKDRIRRHISKYYLNLEDNYKNRWIKSELSKGNKIIIEEIDLVQEENWKESEKYWIEQFRNWGFRLVNTTEGGEGIILTKELIEKRNESNKNSEKRKLAYSKLRENYKTNSEIVKNHQIQEFEDYSIGKRNCNLCGKEIIYKSKYFKYVIRNIRRAENENRICNSCKSSGEKNYFYGRKLNDGKIKQERYGKKILQFDLDDNLIDEFNSIREASEKTGIDRKSISNCAKGIKHYNTAKGYKFKIKE